MYTNIYIYMLYFYKYMCIYIYVYTLYVARQFLKPWFMNPCIYIYNDSFLREPLFSKKTIVF